MQTILNSTIFVCMYIWKLFLICKNFATAASDVERGWVRLGWDEKLFRSVFLCCWIFHILIPLTLGLLFGGWTNKTCNIECVNFVEYISMYYGYMKRISCKCNHRKDVGCELDVWCWVLRVIGTFIFWENTKKSKSCTMHYFEYKMVLKTSLLTQNIKTICKILLLTFHLHLPIIQNLLPQKHPN